MEVIFKVWLEYVDVVGKKHGSTYAQKTVELPMVPSIGMEIEDAAWENYMAVKNVILNLAHPHGYAYLGSIDCGDEQSFRKIMEKHQENNWIIHGRGAKII
jgi:hypothetical protein